MESMRNHTKNGTETHRVCASNQRNELCTPTTTSNCKYFSNTTKYFSALRSPTWRATRRTCVRSWARSRWRCARASGSRTRCWGTFDNSQIFFNVINYFSARPSPSTGSASTPTTTRASWWPSKSGTRTSEKFNVQQCAMLSPSHLLYILFMF